jgi:hypothetical protein
MRLTNLLSSPEDQNVFSTAGFSATYSGKFSATEHVKWPKSFTTNQNLAIGVAMPFLVVVSTIKVGSGLLFGAREACHQGRCQV